MSDSLFSLFEKEQRDMLNLTSAPSQHTLQHNISEYQEEEQKLKELIRNHVKEEYRELLGKRGNTSNREALAKVISQEVARLTMGNTSYSINLKNNRERIVATLINDLSGFGPLDPILLNTNGDMDKVSEIQVNGPGKRKIRIEQDGKRRWLDNLFFEDKAHLLRVIEQILIPTNRPFDSLHPFVDAWLPDGSRVNAVFDDIGVDGPYLSIRKFLYQYTIDQLLAMNPAPISVEAVELLRLAIENDLGILIAGGTGAGKTTWLNALAGLIPFSQSIVSGEDSLEIALKHPDVRRHLTRPANMDGKGEVTMLHVIKNMMRQFPDWIIIGETRGDEAWEIVKAGNTGHRIMTTVHANSAEDAIERYSDLIYSYKPLNEISIKKNIRRAFQLVVYAYRDKRTGIRMISEIAQVGGIKNNGELEIVPLFTRKTRNSPLVYTGAPFLFAEEFKDTDTPLPAFMRAS